MPHLTRRSLLAAGLAAPLLAGPLGFAASARAEARKEPVFRRIRTQYIAALGDPKAKSGDGVETWGWWYKDPGPRGVFLKDYPKLVANGGKAPHGWQFDINDWWVDENSILMEKPIFDAKPGLYVVTGDRSAVSILTIHEKDAAGSMKWELSYGASLHDVTHMPCRSARYTRSDDTTPCTPANANLSDYPVTPGGLMPPVAGCKKQDYSVLFVIGEAISNAS